MQSLSPLSFLAFTGLRGKLSPDEVGTGLVHIHTSMPPQPFNVNRQWQKPTNNWRINCCWSLPACGAMFWVEYDGGRWLPCFFGLAGGIGF